MLINGIEVNRNNLAYKGVDDNLHTNCGKGGYTYDKPLGEWYEVAPNEDTENTVFCHQYGFHCARNPLDCYDYMGRTFLVEVGGDIDEEDDMLCATHIRFIKELDELTFVAHALKYNAEHPKMLSSRIILSEKYEVKNWTPGFVIVKGKNPKVMAPKDTIVGIIKDGEIPCIDMWVVGKDGYKSNRYYGIGDKNE